MNKQYFQYNVLLQNFNSPYFYDLLFHLLFHVRYTLTSDLLILYTHLFNGDIDYDPVFALSWLIVIINNITIISIINYHPKYL